ncbi:MAG: prepilin-type N-terminal cleavage/methylation domain-containing protein [Pirellulales bacterium]|nr:prepilin-type N-terminal cleavage/methylation domain-containing protein [Pirellulales bacterium]
MVHLRAYCCSASRRRAAARRRGVTLVELLVVLLILSVLAAVALPTLRTAREGRNVREATRAINVYFGAARNRAIELGRPCGVVIERFEGVPECAMVLSQAEVPPPYAGEMMDTTVEVQDRTYTDATCTACYWPDGSIVLKLGIPEGEFANRMIRRGDRIRLNHQGPLFTIVDDPMDNPPQAAQDWDFPLDSDGYIIFFDPTGAAFQDTNNNGHIDNLRLTLRLDPSQAQRLPWPRVAAGGPNLWSPRVPFEVFRQPRKSATPPLQLPAGAVIDLEPSGTETVAPALGWTGSTNADPLIVMFSPNGSLDRLVYTQALENPPNSGQYSYLPAEVDLVEPLFLLVGRRDKVPADLANPTDPAAGANWFDAKSLWITLNPQTGLVTAAENDVTNFTAPAAFNYKDPLQRAAALAAVRRYARQSQGMGGR